VIEGYVSLERAKEDYRVAIDPVSLRVDRAETKKTRGEQ
jgi:hypothetical protein